jgi:hypothetical protein
MRMRHIVKRGLSGSTIFFPHYLINGTIFGGGGGNLLNTKYVFLFFLKIPTEIFLIPKTNQ